MKIPKQIQLAGRTIKIEFTDEIYKQDNATGMACYHEGRIQLLHKNTKIRHVTEDEMYVSFIHEILHFCLMIGCDEKYNTHELIDPLSELLYQAFKQIND